MKKKTNISYWLRKLFVSSLIQKILPRIIIRKLVFDTIYHSKHWVHHSKNLKKEHISISGPGSNLNKNGENTNTVMLKKIIKKYKIKSIIDVPCGDFIWMEKVMNKNKKLKYLGIDIVQNLIENNKKNYKNKNINFKSLDIFEIKSLKKFNYDLIICKDFFIHCCFEDIKNLISKIKNSKIKYLLCDNHTKLEKNTDIVIGKHREINLMKFPFNLKKPIFKYLECKVSNREVLLFKIKNL